MALAVGATTWLYYQSLPARWALLGGLLLCMHSRMILQWGSTYWGGSLAMLGGSLTFGGLFALLAKPKWTNAGIFGLAICRA